MTSVSIVVPSFQGDSRLRRLFHCLEQQVTDVEWEVVVVLDGSKDSSEAVAIQWAERIPITLIARKVNRGRTVTLNEGFEAASHEILIRCDDDLMPAPNYVCQFASDITADPHTGVVGLYRNEYPDTPYAKVFGRQFDQRFRREAYMAPPDKRYLYWAGNCAVHRDVWDVVGPYDVRYREYGWEDIDWGYRLLKAGYRISLDPKLETIHRVAATTAAIRFNRARLSGRANTKFLAINGLPQPASQASVWSALVRVATPVSGERAGGVIDRRLATLPPAVARRLIDLGIQASFRRGAREAGGDRMDRTSAMGTR